MRKAPRILFAGLFHETHTFLDGITGLESFHIARGEEISRCRGDSSPMGGALEFAEEAGWEVIPTVDYRATPGATVSDAVVSVFWRELAERVPQMLDGVFLVLHGAMVSQSCADVEGEILARLRGLVGLVPVFGVFDLHANFTQRMADAANCLVAHRENPHTDGREAARIAAGLLQRSLTSGVTPQMAWFHPAIVWPPTGTATAAEPMRGLEAFARQLEAENPALWAVSVCAGFAFADTPDTGVSFVIVTSGELEAAHEALRCIGALAEQQAEAGNVSDPPINDVLGGLDPGAPGLTVLVEPSDNIGAGAPGDGTGALRALVARGVQNAAVAICDPAAVARLSRAAIGDKLTLLAGGRGSVLDAGPLRLEVELVRVGSGLFELEDKNSHLASMAGDRFDMGSCAVVRHAGITILLTSERTPPFDLGQWRSQGIEPTDLSVIVVKAAVAHRRAYDPIAARMLWVDTPGPCTSDLRSLPYRHIRRPIYPLDSSA